MVLRVRVWAFAPLTLAKNNFTVFDREKKGVCDVREVCTRSFVKFGSFSVEDTPPV